VREHLGHISSFSPSPLFVDAICTVTPHIGHVQYDIQNEMFICLDLRNTQYFVDNIIANKCFSCLQVKSKFWGAAKHGKPYIRSMEVWTIRHTKAYHISYEAYSLEFADYLPIIQKNDRFI
jgi:hypothetical protein